jgi:hypothetical protein
LRSFAASLVVVAAKDISRTPVAAEGLRKLEKI